jgi:hypothetical protein
VSELTLVPRQPVPKLKPSKLRDVLNLVRYVQNPQNATFFEALASDPVNEVAEATQSLTVKITAVVWMSDLP